MNRRNAKAPRPRLVVGLLNNMADAALAASERQFGGLLAEAAGGDVDVELRLFSLTEIRRGERARAGMAGRYAGPEALAGAGLDGLIVTGAEPFAADLEGEAYWPSLVRVMDWTEAARTPVIWSCLAAHAAAQHQGGVRRRPLDAKFSGVFPCRPTGDHPLTAGLAEAFCVPHSRWNDLDEAALTAAGYEVLTRSPVVGVDAFARRGGAFSLHFQGHPEYDADSLLREYGRDVGRFLRGERPAHPAAPFGYFDAGAEQALADLAERAVQRPDPAMLPAYQEILTAARPAQTWRPPAVTLYRAWLDHALGRALVPRTGVA